MIGIYFGVAYVLGVALLMGLLVPLREIFLSAAPPPVRILVAVVPFFVPIPYAIAVVKVASAHKLLLLESLVAGARAMVGAPYDTGSKRQD